jgi:biopolymer transport protein ExbD
MNIRRRRRPSTGMNITPLIDIVFIFFMLTSRFITQTAHNINLPESVTAAQPQKPRIVLHVAKDEKIYLNRDKTPVPAPLLEKRLARELAHYRKKPPVIIMGDEKISLGLTIRLLDLVKLAGGESVDITTVKAGTTEQ